MDQSITNPLPRIGVILAKLEPLAGLAKNDPLWKENLPIVNDEIDVAKKDLRQILKLKDLSRPEGLKGRKAKQLHKLLAEVEDLL